MTGSHVQGASSPPLLDMTIGALLEATAVRQPEATALIVRHQGVRWSYGELLARVDDLARGLLTAGLRPGNRIGDISAAIGEIAHAAGLKVNLDFGGHGVGREMHGDPHIANDGRRKRGLPLRAGLVFAIEPWFLRGTDKIYTDDDGWTLRSVDGSRGAHSEHTVAITDDGPLVLTARG